MKRLEIKCAVESGFDVFWSNSGYRVKKDDVGQWLIVHRDSTIGLTASDGFTLNGAEDEFYSPEWSALNSFQRDSIYRLWTVGIAAQPLANWIKCETPCGARHTIMSESGVDSLVEGAAI